MGFRVEVTNEVTKQKQRDNKTNLEKKQAPSLNSEVKRESLVDE
jgi:hypothetical protein